MSELLAMSLQRKIPTASFLSSQIEFKNLMRLESHALLMVDLLLLRISLDLRSFSSTPADFRETDEDLLDFSVFFLSTLFDDLRPPAFAGAFALLLRSVFLGSVLALLVLALVWAFTFLSPLPRLSASLALDFAPPSVFLLAFALALILSLADGLAPLAALALAALALAAALFLAEADYSFLGFLAFLAADLAA